MMQPLDMIDAELAWLRTIWVIRNEVATSELKKVAKVLSVINEDIVNKKIDSLMCVDNGKRYISFYLSIYDLS